jgi:hypothetical protein
MRAQAWPAGPTAAWPDEGPTTSPPRSAWEATPEAADHPTPLTSPNASTPSSASPSRRSSSSLASEARLASMAARAAHLMDDVDRLRASNLEVPRLRRECEELRAAAARADGAEAAAAELSARLGAEAAARGAERADAARRTSALESDLAAARKALDVLAAERDALRPPETPLERFYDARTAAAVVSPSLRRPKLVASATETLLDLPSARRPRLTDSASVAPDDRAVEVALLRANLQALRLEAEQLRRAAAAKPPPVPPPPPARPEIAPPPPVEPEIAPPPVEPEPVEAPATPPESPRAEWAVELVGRDDAERFKLGRDGLPATSRRAMLRVGRRLALDADGWKASAALSNVSGVDYDARGTGLVRVAHDAGAYYFRVANRAVVGELIRAIEAGGGNIRATPTFRERDAVPASPGGAARAALRRRRRRGFR